MQILTPEGVPRTNGEVYAILRRRRDERSSKRLPPFSLQNSLTNHYPFLSSTSSFTSASALYFQSRQRLQQQQQQQLLLANDASGGKAASLTPEVITTAPQLTVLLTEVLVLQYLTHQADLSSVPIPPPAVFQKETNGMAGEGGCSDEERHGTTLPPHPNGDETLGGSHPVAAPIHSLYGPGSVFDPVCYHHHYPTYHHEDERSGADEEVREQKPPHHWEATPEEHSKVTQPRLPHVKGGHPTHDDVVLSSHAYLASLAERYRCLQDTPPIVAGGQSSAVSHYHNYHPAHVLAVESLLRLYESHGRQQERRWADAIRKLIQRTYLHHVYPPSPSDRQIPLHSAARATEGSAGTHFLLAPPTPLSEAFARDRTALMPNCTALFSAAETSALPSSPRGDAAESEEERLVAATTTTQSEDSPSGPCTQDDNDETRWLQCGAPLPPMLLTPLEVLQLLNGHPQRVVEVYRLLDDFTSRWSGWVSSITSPKHKPLFARSASALLHEAAGNPEDVGVPLDAEGFAEALTKIFATLPCS